MDDEMMRDERMLFEQALDVPPPERRDFVRDQCSDDPDLQARVLRLLAAHERAEETAGADLADVVAALPPVIPEWVDSYRILQRLGEGGMGIVYLAEQTRPVRRQVALKVLKTGIDSSEVVARFHAEGQAMALMSHPNIARILEAGVVDQRPYFVMEYVPGVPITEYCDRQRLSVTERLRLFVDVCRGVHHAHQKGIIHRDIKPTNILIMEEGEEPIPKIIDFGIAKAVGLKLTDETVHTAFGCLIGTPEYMSPEQAQLTALDVDTRSDVYSLGAVLYELLTGRRVFELRRDTTMSLADMQRIITEQEPERPSTRLRHLNDGGLIAARQRRTEPDALARILRDDLDWITLRALDKDRSRRYGSASEFAADIERALSGQTVNARPPSATYKTRKFVRRHRLGVAAASIVLLALIGATLVSAGFAISEGRQRRLAEIAGEEAVLERDTALAVIEFLTEDLLEAAQPSNRPGRGREVTMREVLDVAAKRIEAASQPGGRFHERPLVEARIRDAIAETYRSLAVYDAAETHARRALTLRRTHLGETHEETIASLYELGAIYRHAGRFGDAERLLGRMLEIRLEHEPADSPRLADAQAALANVYAQQGQFEKAEPLNRAALAIREQTLGPDHATTVATRANLGAMLFMQDRYDEAEPLLQRSLDAETQLYGEDHPDTLLTKNSLAVLYARTGRPVEAGRLLSEASESCARVYGESHPHTLAALTNLGRFYVESGQFELAEPVASRAVELTRAALGDGHGTTKSACEVLATLYERQRRGPEAEAARLVWRDTWIAHVRAYEVGASEVNELAWFLLGAESASIRDVDLALEFARRAATMTNYEEPTILDTLARALYAHGDVIGALRYQREALSLVEDDDPQRGEYEAFLRELESAADDARRDAASDPERSR